MSLITLKSTNPDFSFVIQKRPPANTEEVSSDVVPMMVKKLKEGIVFGFYPIGKTDTYVVHFKDGFDEVSFKKDKEEEFEYLNISRYNSSMFLSLAMKEFFNHLENNKYSESARDIEGYEHIMTINMIYVSIPKYLEFFKSSFPNFQIEGEVLVGHNMKIIITTKKTLHELINYVNLLSLFLIMINNDENLYIEDAIVERYLKVMNTLNTSYYIRYLFKLKVLTTSPNLFKKNKLALEKNNKEVIHFVYGDTHTQRIEAIQSRLDLNREIIDIGCGEGRYALKLAPILAKNNEELLYHAIDIDPKCLEEVQFKSKRKDIDNISYYNDFSSFVEMNSETKMAYDIICTEVIEHMTIEDASKNIKSIVRFGSLMAGSKIIFTTPNADFNKNYNLEGMRHDDHKWEYGVSEFKTFMEGIFDKLKSENLNFTFKHINIGDSVNDEYVTQGYVIETL